MKVASAPSSVIGPKTQHHLGAWRYTHPDAYVLRLIAAQRRRIKTAEAAIKNHQAWLDARALDVPGVQVLHHDRRRTHS